MLRIDRTPAVITWAGYLAGTLMLVLPLAVLTVRSGAWQQGLLLYAIAWVDDKDSPWFDKNLPAIARKNDMNIIGANWTVPQKVDWHGHGDSRILSRAGKTLAKPKRKIGETILYADLPIPPAPANAAARVPSKGPLRQ